MTTDRSKTLLSVCLIAALLLAAASATLAQTQTYPYRYEDFSTTLYRDPSATTALWDTSTQRLTLHPFAISQLDSISYGFSTEAIAVDGGIACVGTQYDGLLIFDVSDPSNLSLLGSSGVSDYILSVAIHGDLAITGTTIGGRIYDISNPSVPVPVGDIAGAGVYRDLEVWGDLLCVASAGPEQGIVVVDITDPSMPYLGSIGTLAWDCFGVAVSGNTAYVTGDGTALASFEISSQPFVQPLPLDQVGPGIPGRDVVVDGDLAYVAADASGLLVIDVGDPANLAVLGQTAIADPAMQVAADGDYVYVAQTGGGLQVYDVTDPTDPVQVEDAFFAMVYCRSVAAAGGVAFPVDATGTLYSVKVADAVLPPISAGAYDTGGLPSAVEVHGDHAFVAGEIGGLEVVDIGDPATPALAGSYDVGAQVLDVLVAGNRLYMAAATTGLWILDISDPASPSEIGHVTTGIGDARRVEVAGSFAYVADEGNGLLSVDVNYPGSAFVVSDLLLPSPTAMCLGGDYAYVVAGNLVVVDISNPPVLVGLGSDPTVMNATGMDVSGSYLYVADYDAGLFVFDVSDPMGPAFTDFLPLASGHAYDVVVEGNTAVVTDGSGVVLVDVTDPTSPVFLDRADTPGPSAGLDVAGDFAFIATLDAGLSVFQVFERDLNIVDRMAGSIDINPTAGEVSRFQLGAAQQGTILWEASANGGTDWTPVTPGGGWVDVPGGAEGSDLRWRATLGYDTYDLTPYCAMMQIDYQFADDDFDGVPNGMDLCPAERASQFDFNRDGCLDPARGGRHVEYWPSGTNVSYYIHEDGIRTITDGSDFTAITSAMDKWAAIAGTSLGSVYGGTTTQDTAVAFDGINTITGADDSYEFDSHVIAVGISCSFTEPTYFQGKLYSPGEMVDADMIFNPAKAFKTDTQGQGIDLESVATHEAGHLYGLSHSLVRTSTMFYALGTGTSSRTLEEDDVVSYTKSYPDGDLLPPNYIVGTITEGGTSDPVAGAIVYAIHAASGDTAACDISLPDGSYQFAGLADGDYYIAIHPFDESAATYYMKPAWVNWYVDSIGVSLFVPEYWDGAESSTDDPADRDVIALLGGGATRDLVTNVDTEGPVIVDTYPNPGDSGIPVETAVLVRFDEPIDHNTVQGNFKLAKNTFPAAYIGGKAYIMDDDSVISFRPTEPLEYATAYVCTLFAGIQDKYGNTMSSADMIWFSTEAAPPLGISSVVPNQGAVGSVIVINGAGFDLASFSNNRVLFPHVNGSDTVQAQALSATPTQIVVAVPPDAASGWVAARVPPVTSNSLPFTVLPPDQTPRGFEVGTASLGAIPRMVEVTPGGNEAVVATADGVTIVDVDPGSAGFTGQVSIPIAGGVDGLAVSPDGSWIYAVQRSGEKLHVVDAGGKTLVATLDVNARPYGVAVEPGGNRAFVPTDDGDVQVWDMQQGSPNYRKRIGAIVSPDANFQGRLAIDPAGGYLLAITGTGDMLAFDLGPDTFLVDVAVGPDPRDIVVEPGGGRAYVADATGSVTIVSLADMFKVTDIPAGGSLRGLSMTPAGLYLFAANRELNLLDVIDLDPNSPDWWKVTTTVPLGINPVDVELTPDGAYAVSILEDERKLVVTAVGVGPVLESVMPQAAVSGAQLVLAGSGFGTDVDSLTVQFPQVTGATLDVQPQRSTGTALTVSVPGGITSGPISVTRDRGTHLEVSNTQYFQALFDPGARALRRTAQIFEPGYDLTDALAVSPDGDQLIVGTEGGELLFFDIDPGSGTYHKLLGSTPLGSDPVHEIVFTPDGKRAYASTQAVLAVYEVDANRSSSTYRSVVGTVDFSLFPGESIWELSASPDGRWLLAYNLSYGGVAFVDIAGGSPTRNEDIDVLSVPSVSDMAFHPGGEYVYCAAEGDTAVYVVDMVGAASPTFREVVDILKLSDVYPGAISFTPAGDTCLAFGRQVAILAPYVVTIDATAPDHPSYTGQSILGYSSVPYSQDAGRIRVSPAGSDAILNAREEGLILMDLAPAYPVLSQISTAGYLVDLCHSYTPDNSRAYAVGTVYDTVEVFDFTQADGISMVSGDAQTGIAGRALPAPLRVKVTQSGGTVPVQGVGVTFTITGGGGVFAGSNAPAQIAVTDANGIAKASWILGPSLGAQAATAGGEGLVGTPISFTATAQTDPATLPIRLLDVSPADGEGGIGVTTTIVANFSRGVDKTSVGSSSFFFHAAGNTTPIAASVGYANDLERVSLTPFASLDYGTSYEIEILSAIRDTSANALENPDTVTFTTAPPPPPALSAVDPPSATAAVPLTLSGKGFNADYLQNTVLFGTTAATPVSGGVDHLNVEVPSSIAAGALDLSVVTEGEASNAISFTVLVPTNTSADQVIGTVSSGAATRSMVISPNGAMAYAVGPSSDVVVPIDIDGLVSLQPITVGTYPISIDIHPDGDYVYVANFQSGDISIIDSDPLSPGFLGVDSILTTGGHPIDLVVTSDGDRVYAVLAPPDTVNLVVIDSDDQSANWHSVIGTVKVGTSSKSVTVSPDGTRLYIGTDEGYVVMEVGDNSYAVIGTVKQGSATKTVTISPDGTMLFVLTTQGDVDIYYVEPDSEFENDVIGTVKTTNGTKEVTVSPDGSLLYLIQEQTDLVLVVEVTVIGSIGVTGELPPGITTAVIDTVYAGEDPEAFVFSPVNPNLVLVTNSGPKTVTLLSTSFVSLEVPPDTLIASFSTVQYYDLDGFEMTNSSNEVFTYRYSATTEGPAAFAAGQDSSALSGATPALVPGATFTPPPARLEIPPVRTPGIQRVFYRVSAVENPAFVTVDTTTIWFDPPVPSLISAFEAEALAAGVKLNWELSSEEPVSGFKVYRRAGEEMPDVALGDVLPADRRSFLDESAAPDTEYRYRLSVVSADGTEVTSHYVVVRTRPRELALYQNFPNPFNPTTTIAFSVPSKLHINLSIYNVEGRLVATLVDEPMTPGYKKIVWNGENRRGNGVSSGIYFYRLTAGKKTLTRKMVLIR